MNIAVLGTGTVGRAIAGRLHELGHTVVVGTRDPQSTLGRAEPDANLGTAIMCSVLYQRMCPADVVASAAASDRPAVRRAANLASRAA